MRKFLFAVSFLLLSPFGLIAQNFEVSVTGIKEGDSIRLVVQQEKEFLFKQWVQHNPDGPSVAVFDQLVEGLWALSIDATGYTFPSSSVFNFPETTNASVELTPLLNDNYTYNWRDDGSAAGHATQSYIAEPTEIVILNDTVSVPTGFSAIKLRTEYGILLSDDVEPWSNEDAYRLYKMFSNLPYDPYGEGQTVDYSNGDNVRGVFYLSSDEIYEDISLETINGVKHATVSQSAFTYAEPQIAKLDGIRGKFFSKRLYHAVVNFITDFARDDERVDWLARERFGVRFMKPDQETEELMGEDQSNFQEFFNSEKLEILAMFEELPEGFHKQEGLKYLVRRINGQPNPTYPTAPAIAWTGFNTIEFMGVAFNTYDINYIRRLILHEKAHFLWAYTFDDSVKDEWIEIGGWFKDPTSGSGWSTYNTTEFVSAYAHDKNPNEDMAESIAMYLTNPDALINVSMRKYEFIRDRIMHGTRYIAQIREDLTFTVYNLFPDYVFPGKVIEVDIDVQGAAEEDKIVNVKAILNSTDVTLDGASFAYLRFSSSIGTIHDVQLYPQNGELDSVLVGSATFSKYEKNGYWSLNSFSINDKVGNKRYENTSTLGIKLYIENPLEDIIPPKFNNDFQFDLINGKFSQDYFWETYIDEVNGVEGQALRFRYSWDDQTNLESGTVNVVLPNSNESELFEVSPGSAPISQDVQTKEFEHYFAIPEFYPTGQYKVSYNHTADQAGNRSGVYHVDDPDDFYIDPSVQPPNTFKFQRDSVYVETAFPDMVPPEIDINQISISAEPTNPLAPNGETRVDMQIIARDFSEFEGKESGIRYITFTLQGPQGQEFGVQTGNGTMNHEPLWEGNDYGVPNYGDDWKVYNFDFLLPAGSAQEHGDYLQLLLMI